MLKFLSAREVMCPSLVSPMVRWMDRWTVDDDENTGHWQASSDWRIGCLGKPRFLMICMLRFRHTHADNQVSQDNVTLVHRVIITIY